MAHHAYFATGERAAALAAARSFAERGLGVVDIIYLSFELFSVDDARRLIDAASVSGIGGRKVIIASMTRIFHEAQNALLKIAEEPPEGTVLILCVPSEGVFLSTLRSRLLPIPDAGERSEPAAAPESVASRFLAASAAEREKIVNAILDHAKSDKDETKQRARREAIELVQGLTRAAHAALKAAKTPRAREEPLRLLEDLDAFMPILYERSAPLKLMFEHLLLVFPQGLAPAKV